MSRGSAFVVVPDGWGNVLAVSRGPGAWVWGLPGGRQDKGESLYETALRELYEETGLRPLAPMTTLVYQGDPRKGRAFFLLPRYAGVVRSSPEGDVAWLPWPELIARGGRWQKMLIHLRVQAGG